MDPTTTPTNTIPTMYSFSMQEMIFSETSITYTFMSRNKRFILEISAETLIGEGNHVEQFYTFKDNIDDPDLYCDFETWALGPIHERIMELVPFAVDRPTSLGAFYEPDVFCFELWNERGVLSAREVEFGVRGFGDCSPKVAVVDDVEYERLSNSDISKDNFVSRSTLPISPLIPASQLVRAAPLDSMEEIMCEIPRIVRSVNTNEEFFFKAADKGRAFQREVEIFAKLQKISEFDHELSNRTSRIVGLVSYDGKEELLMGMLLEKIEGVTMRDAVEEVGVEERIRWMDRVEETVGRLHRYGIVWGDVSLRNVMIDASGDAIVIDFGGARTREYVERGHIDTKEGDLEGLRKMRLKLLS